MVSSFIKVVCLEWYKLVKYFEDILLGSIDIKIEIG